MLNVVVLNGGRGAATLIPALLARRGLNVTSVVNAYDDGKSTGAIRRFFGMLGPSDLRKVQELMLPQDDPDLAAHRHWFRYRYPLDVDRAAVLADLTDFARGAADALAGARSGNARVVAGMRAFVAAFLRGLALIEPVIGEPFDFADCSVMNCVFAGAFLAHDRNMEEATLALDRLFRLTGTVLPTSIENKQLVALRENGEILYCEAEIVELRSNVRIDRVYLLDRPLDRDRFERLSLADKRAYLDLHHCFVGVSAGVERALRAADLIIYAAGTQHSSLYPTCLATGLAGAIADNRRAFKAFITNIGADYETPSYRASDYLRGAYRYLCLSTRRDFAVRELFDVALINASRIKADETYVTFDADNFGDLPVELAVGAFESAERPGQHDGERIVAELLRRYEARDTDHGAAA